MTSDDTTYPAVDDTSEGVKAEVPAYGLALAWSEAEPWRVGEAGLCRPFETSYFGRTAACVALERQRPGVRWGERAGTGGIAGNLISRQQLEATGTAVGINVTPLVTADVTPQDTPRTLINGAALQSARLEPGHAVLLKGGALLVCVRRPRMMPALPGRIALPAYGDPDEAGIVGESFAIWQLRAQLAEAAVSGENVLLLGETGCGKELAAKALHLWSNRANRPRIAHNAPATTVSILELEFFGRVKGYPQANDPAVVGLLTQANTGTLFIDEIANLAMAVQEALLRPMDPGLYKVMGDSRERLLDLLWIGATNCDPDDPRLLRADFVHRFGRRIRVPPLRERPEDIVLLLRHLMLKLAETRPELRRFLIAGPDGRLYPRLRGDFVDLLVRHPLPGNMRQLRGFLIESIEASPSDVLRRPPSLATSSASVPPSAGLPSSGPVTSPATSAAKSPLTSPAPSSATSSVPSSPPPTSGVKEGRPPPPNRTDFLCVWVMAGKNVTAVARKFGVSRMQVYRWLKAFGIDPK